MTDSTSPCPFVFAPLLLSTRPTTFLFVERKSIAAASAAIGVPTECPFSTVGPSSLRVKVVRAGTLEPAHADGPKLDDSCDGRDGVWRNEGARQEDEGRSVFGSMTEMELGY